MEQRYGCKGKAAWRPNRFQLSTSLQGLENMHQHSQIGKIGREFHSSSDPLRTDIEDARVLHLIQFRDDF